MKTTFTPADPGRRIAYKLRVYGEVSEMWLEDVNGKEIAFDGEVTSIHVTVDQAALRGILGRLWDLNLTLLSVTSEDTRVEPKIRRHNG
ncbi:MAG: hypothetical protein GTO14_24560 [Anaerolineales bacterium]|nr:hypothetical protein [Anaerolineales bacterium]